MLPEGFTHITLGLVDEFMPYFVKTPQKSADYSFTNLWGWADYYGLALAFDKGLCWVYQEKPLPRLWAPLGDWSAADFTKIQEFANKTITLHRVPSLLAQQLKEQFGERLEEKESREHWEYLYKQSDLATLSGNKFHKKKNHVNAYTKAYGIDYRPIDDSNIDHVLALQEDWCKWRDCESSPALQAESDVIFRVVGNWNRLPGLSGGALYVEEKMVAFSIGESLDKDNFVVHFEKVQPDYKGIYQAMNQTFAEKAAAGYEFVNREQDMGEEGLRQAKLTYNPLGFLEKSTLVIKPSIE